jgi:hypothetical protein
MTHTPYQRWQQRTNKGREMAGGWASAHHTPPKRGEYEVRGHPKRSHLTWAYGNWWYMPIPDCGGIPYWRLAGGCYTWRGDGACDNSGIHGADLLFKAVELGSEEAETELREMGWKGDYRPYVNDRSWKDKLP